VTILGHIQACPTRFLAQNEKTFPFVILKNRWPNKNRLFLGRPASACKSSLNLNANANPNANTNAKWKWKW